MLTELDDIGRLVFVKLEMPLLSLVFFQANFQNSIKNYSNPTDQVTDIFIIILKP